jgi:acyl-CoA thioesterase
LTAPASPATVRDDMDDRIAALAERVVGCPYGRFVGVETDHAERGRARLRLPARRDTGNRNGSLHGGVIASLLDLAGTLAARSVAEDPGAAATTADLAVQYLAPAADEAVTADATVTRRGREIVFVDAAVAAEDGTPVARAVAAIRLGVASDDAPLAAAPSPLDPRAPLLARRSGSAFTARLAIHMASVEPGRAVFVLPFAPALADADGGLHEGALAALVDSAGGAASWSLHGLDPAGRAATIAMHLACDRRPPGDDVVVEARTTLRQGALFFNAVTLTARASGRAVVAGSVTYRIVRP